MKNILTLLSFLFLQQVYATTDTLLLDHERHIWIKAVILKADTFIDSWWQNATSLIISE